MLVLARLAVSCKANADKQMICSMNMILLLNNIVYCKLNFTHKKSFGKSIYKKVSLHSLYD